MARGGKSVSAGRKRTTSTAGKKKPATAAVEVSDVVQADDVAEEREKEPVASTSQLQQDDADDDGDTQSLTEARDARRSGRIASKSVSDGGHHARPTTATKSTGRGRGKGKSVQEPEMPLQYDGELLEADSDDEMDLQDQINNDNKDQEGLVATLDDVEAPVAPSSAEEVVPSAGAEPEPEPPDAPAQNDADSDDSDDEDDAGGMAFDLDAMLDSAMQAVALPPEALSGVQSLASTPQRDTITEEVEAFDIDAMLNDAMLQGQPVAPDMAAADSTQAADTKAASSEDTDSDSDDDETGMAFDLDAALAAAMPADATGTAPADNAEPALSDASDENDYEDSDSDDEDEAGFDLDAQIGAAMTGLTADADGVAALQLPSSAAAEMAEAVRGADSEIQDNIQEMLKAAMDRATGEFKREAEITGQAIPADAADTLLQLPAVPKARPLLDDDGNQDNAFNAYRRSHPHALVTAYACTFMGCDRTYARQQNLHAHLRAHLENEQHVCHVCTLPLNTAQQLRWHMRTHNPTRQWRYRCTACHNLFPERSSFTAHRSSPAATPACRLPGTCELDMLPFTTAAEEETGAARAARITALAGPPLTRGPHDHRGPPFFVNTPFSDAALYAATATTHLADAFARQYDREQTLLSETDPAIDVALALRQTIANAGLTAKEAGALLSVLSHVAHARNSGLQASMEVARRTQVDVMKRTMDDLYRRRVESDTSQELHKIPTAAEVKRIAQLQSAADGEATKKSSKKASAAQSRQTSKNGSRAVSEDIPVPQLASPKKGGLPLPGYA